MTVHEPKPATMTTDMTDATTMKTNMTSMTTTTNTTSMTTTTPATILRCLPLVAAALLAACGDGTSDGHDHTRHGHEHAAPTAPQAPTGTFPAALFTEPSAGEPAGVGVMKPKAAQGDRVLIVGRIGGSEQPFLADRAMFSLVDPSVKLCGEGDPADDHCKTPWDFCCEPRENLRRMSVSIVANGADGAPIGHTLLGQGGLKPGSRVVVEGTVATVGPDGAATIAAERIVAR
jgi:hypothetical protein